MSLKAKFFLLAGETCEKLSRKADSPAVCSKEKGTLLGQEPGYQGERKERGVQSPVRQLGKASALARSHHPSSMYQKVMSSASQDPL